MRIANADVLGPRILQGSVPEALVGYTKTKNNKSPPVTKRLNVLIENLHKRNGSNATSLTARQIEDHRSNWKRITRQVSFLMKEEDVVERMWTDIPTDCQLYYALILEERIESYGFHIWKCRQQWAARTLLQEAMKTERRTEKRRAERVSHYIKYHTFFFIYSSF
jgi:hypothetical protein